MLDSTLDARKAKSGQVITASIAQDVPLPSGGKIRAGSRLIGNVLQTGVKAGGGSYISIRFDRVHTKSGDIPVTISLRALASPREVQEAQLPKYSPARRGESAANWITTQIGDDVVYRGGGHVMHGEVVVGDPVRDGVLVELLPAPEAGCAAGSGGRRLALWVFSSSACGVYGFFDELEIAHDKSPIGDVVLESKANVHLPVGTATLLVTEGAPGLR